MTRTQGGPLSWLSDPNAKSCYSTSAVRNPRGAASRAIPAPTIPPPMISTSQVNVSNALGASALEGTEFMRPSRWHSRLSMRERWSRLPPGALLAIGFISGGAG